MLNIVPKCFRRHTETVRTVVVPAALHAPLDGRQRLEIRDWLNLETTQKVLALMEARHPGIQTSRISKVARSEWDERAAVNFLNRIAGWEQYRNHLLQLCETPVTRGDVEETYPEQ